MRKQIFFIMFLAVVFSLFLAVQINAELDAAREYRLKFGHTIRIENIKTEPAEISPGGNGTLKMSVKNNGGFQLKDIRVQIDLPSQLTFLNDISKRKIIVLEANETKNLEFSLIALPTASEGVYPATLKVDYLNYIGDEKQENSTFAIIIKSKPKLFAKIDSSNLYVGKYLSKYTGKNIGEVTITFVNNDVADIKFLTVELQDSVEYDIISSNKKYIGDLDSDDFESVDFRVKVEKGKQEIPLILKATYKDSLNNDYTENFELRLRVRSAEELGIKTNGTLSVILSIIIIAIIGLISYRIYKKRKSKYYTKDGLIIPRDIKRRK